MVCICVTHQLPRMWSGEQTLKKGAQFMKFKFWIEQKLSDALPLWMVMVWIQWLIMVLAILSMSLLNDYCKDSIAQFETGRLVMTSLNDYGEESRAQSDTGHLVLRSLWMVMARLQGLNMILAVWSRPLNGCGWDSRAKGDTGCLGKASEWFRLGFKG